MGALQCTAESLGQEGHQLALVRSCNERAAIHVGPCLLAHPFNMEHDLKEVEIAHVDRNSTLNFFGTLLGEKPPEEEVDLALEGPDGALGLISIGVSKQKAGDSHGALRIFRGALQIRQALFTGAPPAVCDQRDFHTWLLVYKEACELSECIGTRNSMDGALLMAMFGILCHLSGDSDGAIEAYNEALTILEKVETAQKEMTMIVLQSLGDARSERAESDKALEAYWRVLQSLEVRNGVNTLGGAVLLMSLGTAKRAQGNLNDAMEAYGRSLNVLESVGRVESCMGAILLYNLGLTLRRSGQTVDSLHALWKSHAILEKGGLLETPEGRDLCQDLERAKQMFRRGEDDSTAPRRCPV